MGRPPKFKKVDMPSNATELVKLEVMSKNLRRGFGGWNEFKSFVEREDLKQFNLRWLISISDSYMTNGTEMERAISGIISTFATMGIRTLDTITPKDVKLSSNHVRLYDGMSSINLGHCDTYQNYFERIDSVIRQEPFLYKLWREIKSRFQQNSHTLKMINEKHQRGIYNLPPYSEWKEKHYEDDV